MPTITDKEFGKITIRRSARARQVKIRIAPNGTLRASIPLYAPTLLVKRLIKTSRPKLRQILEDYHPKLELAPGMSIGKSHTLVIQTGDALKVTRSGQQIIIRKPDDMELSSSEIIKEARPVIIDALKIEARSYLPKRLAFLAAKHGFSYDKVRFSHASGRWGSCSSNGTISLNIALMKLPFELIDYVLIHELSHTKRMDHSQAFWDIVAAADPDYKLHRKKIKLETPSI